MNEKGVETINVVAKRITCNRCGYVWDYRGKSEYRATCPNCGATTRFKVIPRKGDECDE